MFYRRKVILALFQLFDGQLEKIRLQKLLFLFSQRQQKALYDFIPYKYGCYSYSANADLTTMVKKGILTETESSFITQEKTDYLIALNETDKKLLLEIKSLYGKMNSNTLMKHTYTNYPFFAVNSIKAKEILTKEELERINCYKPTSGKTILFTIGYEGISLEEYLNRLIKNDIKLLVDVRNNPQSMKYGFSKNQLIKYCESLGIKYIHFPEVGIQSEQRQELKTQIDYDKLFATYKKGNLAKTKATQVSILNLLKQYKRIALTCFEANICQCHRKHLAESIESLPEFEYETKHI
ncbi:MAG: DUF488 domain-containing protein [Sphingobacteriales bacterium]|nr:DUF488 domain-containing protein [Sphingobacteriales bacterium]MBI3718938.1 DUF488 domain-containing protein [Sphingobacteriales bacterium]